MLKLLPLLLLPAFAWAQSSTVYKQVDKDGKVTYTEKTPAKDAKKEEGKDGKDSKDGKAAPGTVKKLEMDSQRNVIKSLSSTTEREGGGAAKAVEKRLSRQEQLRNDLEEARRVVDEAKEALESGKDPQDEEWQTIIGAGGKPARIPTEAYHQRIKDLEKAVKDAEAGLAKAETAYRRGVGN